MNADEKILQALDDLRADIKGLKQGQQTLEAGQQALQADVTAVKAETAKIPGVEQRLEHQGKLLTGLTATTATVLEEQQAQRSDIRALHTEVHASKEGPRSPRWPLSATQRHPTPSLIDISWHCSEP